MRTRRHWRLALLGVLLVGTSATCFVGQYVRERGWIEATPTVAYIAFLPNLDTGTTFKELSDRVNGGTLRQWEYRLLVHQCISLLEEQEVSPERLSECADLLARIELGGRNGKDWRPWGSWALVSEIDHEAAIEALAGLLDHEDPAVRVAALQALRQFAGAAVQALPRLLEQVADENGAVRRNADGALRMLTLGSEHALTYPVSPQRPGRAVPGTGGPDDPAFRRFCLSVGRCKVDPACAVDKLTEGLDSVSPTVRAVSIFGLALLRPGPAVFHQIAELEGDTNESVRRTAHRHAAE